MCRIFPWLTHENLIFCRWFFPPGSDHAFSRSFSLPARIILRVRALGRTFTWHRDTWQCRLHRNSAASRARGSHHNNSNDRGSRWLPLILFAWIRNCRPCSPNFCNSILRRSSPREDRTCCSSQVWVQSDLNLNYYSSDVESWRLYRIMSFLAAFGNSQSLRASILIIRLILKYYK